MAPQTTRRRHYGDHIIIVGSVLTVVLAYWFSR